MARRKRDSKWLAVLQRRIAGMKSIDESLDLGGGISVDSLAKTHADLATNLARYNQLLSEADAALNTIGDLELQARDLAERALTGVATRYGKDSSEYEQVGGTRKSERKKPGTGKVALAKAAKAAEGAQGSKAAPASQADAH